MMMMIIIVIIQFRGFPRGWVRELPYSTLRHSSIFGGALYDVQIT